MHLPSPGCPDLTRPAACRHRLPPRPAPLQIQQWLSSARGSPAPQAAAAAPPAAPPATKPQVPPPRKQPRKPQKPGAPGQEQQKQKQAAAAGRGKAPPQSPAGAAAAVKVEAGGPSGEQTPGASPEALSGDASPTSPQQEVEVVCNGLKGTFLVERQLMVR